MMQSFAVLLVTIFGLFLPVLIQHKTDVQQKLATTCLAQSHAASAANAVDHAKGATQKSSLGQCGGGTATAKAAIVPSNAPSTNGAAAPLQTPSGAPAVDTRRMHHRHVRHSRARPRLENAASPSAATNPAAGL